MLVAVLAAALAVGKPVPAPVVRLLVKDRRKVAAAQTPAAVLDTGTGRYLAVAD